jgi:hypothetical protein
MTEGLERDVLVGLENAPLPDVSAMPGRQALLLAALVIGLMMLGIQLWLLTVALELFLSAEGKDIWGLALVSGLVFAGGLLTTWLLSRRPQVTRRGR